MSYAFLMVTHSLLNDSKCINSTLCSNYFKGQMSFTDVTPYITFLLHCESDVNVIFEGVLNHVTKYLIDVINYR